MSDLPKYLSVSNDLRTRIGVGEFATGDRLPSQHALAAEYGVTVMTFRQALSELEAEGLVHAVKGTGTFVSEPSSVRYDLDHLWSFTQEMTQQGLDVVTEVLGVDQEPAGADAGRRALDLDLEVPVVELVRLRSVDGEPVVLQRSTLAGSLWPTIASADLANCSLYEVIEDLCGLVLVHASETIRAVNVQGTDAAALDVVPGSAALESVRVSHTTGGAAFLFDRALLRGASTEIRTERSAAGSSMAFQTLTGPAPT